MCTAHRLVPGTRLEVFPDAGHFPHLDDPLRFVRVLIDFIDTTEPAQRHPGRWKEFIRSSAEHIDAAPEPPTPAGPATAQSLLTGDNQTADAGSA